MTPFFLTRADARKAMVRHHFATSPDLRAAFDRLRSVQFDPIAPIGCNHDLVLQARVPGYRIGDWQPLAYQDRHIYDGWDKQASLVPFEGWALRRFFHHKHRQSFEQKVFVDHREAVAAVLEELTERGPLQPKDFAYQQRRDDWQGSWYGPSVTKRVLKALWFSGEVMTAHRVKGQHVYDLTERVAPPDLLAQPPVGEHDAARELILERHRAMGLVRPNAPPEVWSYGELMPHRKTAFPELVAAGALVPVEVEGVKAHATPEFLALLDLPSLEPRVVFVAPLDPFLWDRKMTAYLFDFDYIWEIYTPEAKRRWGYYVLPVLFGDRLVARAEFWSRDGVLELRAWHEEPMGPPAEFWPALEAALHSLMAYASAQEFRAAEGATTSVFWLEAANAIHSA